MHPRPFLQKSIKVLESLAQKHWSDSVVLEQLKHELTCRSTSRSCSLLRRVEDRLSALHRQRGTQGESGGGGPQDGGLAEKLKQVTAELALARRTLEAQKAEIEALKADLKRERSRAPHGSIFASVHLLDSIPDFSIRAIRKAFQKTFHPDQRTDVDQHRAHEEFVAMRAAFDRIEKLRGLA